MDTKPITEEDKQFTRMVDKESTEIIKSMMMPVNTIYIDSDFLYDYRLGALLMLAKNEDEYNYILSKLNEYECSPSMKITSVFPELNLTETDVDLMEHDLKFEKYVVAGAPKTEFLDEFNSFLAWVCTYNRSQTDSLDLNIIINFREHKMPDDAWEKLRSYLSSGSKHIKVVRTEFKSWDNMPRNLYETLNLLFVYNTPDFASSSMVSNVMKTLLTFKQIVFTYPRVETDFETQEEYKEALDNFSALAGTVFYKFSYIKRSISKGR